MNQRGNYKMRQSSIDKAAPFKPILKQMIDNAKAHFGKLNSDDAAEIIPDVPIGVRKIPVGTFELRKKIQFHYGRPGLDVFKFYFGKSKKIHDKARIKKLYQHLIKKDITYKFYIEHKARCFYWEWCLKPEFMLL
jgi:hypothetical protein